MSQVVADDVGPLRPQQQFASLYTDLSHTVRDLGLLRRRYAYYWTRIGLVLASLGGIVTGFVLLGNSWFQLFMAAALALVLTQVAFLSHDSAHRQIFDSAAWNDWTARVLAGGIAGMSITWWRSKHSKHHNAPNQVGKDPDIGPGVLAFTPDNAVRRSSAAQWLTDRQGWLFFPLLTLEGISLHVSSLQHQFRRGATRMERIEAAVVISRLGGYVAALFLLLPPGKAAAFLGLQLALFGVFLGASFAPNHKGMPLVPATMKLDFLRRQVLMSRNIRGGLLVDFALGGLNYQIEHHLFPSMPRPNLRRVQPIVREYCAKHGVKYTEVGLFESYRIVTDYLNNVGLRARDPFQCPLTAQYRA
ncbi:fatty acid desaturase [Kribbella flavida DSM 17836]|uniref:Fatty acid desaturase n=1 Tax=Kribbella flavida (strain DSM 17836 / JCM 10339 / NBRC 14399) TaxID=479435 RepID=D2Q1Q8_KRIFD|nr:acyl-CoA desaturase [Kribbella flavida]ADB32047.1 fatty acid desaturase [Kribbella flavida DSM 17836]